MQTFKERKIYGDTKADKAACKYNELHLDGYVEKEESEAADKKGTDYWLHKDGRKYSVDFKSHFDCFLFQWNLYSGCHCNPFTPGCNTHYIIQYNEYINSLEFYTIEGYVNKYFNGLSLSDARTIISKYCGRADEDTWRDRAKLLKQDLAPFLRPEYDLHIGGYGDGKLQLKAIAK